MVGDRRVAAPATGEAIARPSRVLFDRDRAEVRADARTILQERGTQIAARPAGTSEVDGYTDALGPPAYNQPLSLRRVHAIADALAATGIPRPRFTTYGHGESDPVADNDTAAHRQLNRRVVVHLPPRERLTGHDRVAAGRVTWSR